MRLVRILASRSSNEFAIVSTFFRSVAITVKTKDLKVMGGTVKVKELTIAEAGRVADAVGSDAMLLAVSFALVEPAMTVEELATLPATYADDFAKIIEAVTE